MSLTCAFIRTTEVKRDASRAGVQVQRACVHKHKGADGQAVSTSATGRAEILPAS